MRSALMILALAGATAAPALAQQAALPGAAKPRTAPSGPASVSRNAPVNGVLVLYGNERCPTDNDGNEVVVCTRRSANEQFRVPKELREFQITPQNESWAVRAQGATTEGVGANATGSCSVVGQSGQTGCFNQAVRANRAANKARAADQTDTDRIVKGY
ncbi:hypothetical protein SAMN05192583_3392 [Sphingomonas gellani]|uniref:Uncharacterized protein n=1 Tax=Sphingomonas gellani TaxID=1166340 RepID=A0A1H8IUA4_9SPHN|nr:hypothetical protein [Sphingomonas gellani]SEN72213.1 hypothetical protein SAMN05192583_3392 [Sphingomonas gellani]